MVPSGKEICEKQLFNLIDRVENVNVSDFQIDDFMPDIYKKLEWLDREQLIKHFVSVEFNRFLQYYQNAPDINVDETHAVDDKKVTPGKRVKNKDFKRSKNSRKKEDYIFSRFFFNQGKKNGINKRKIIDLVNHHLPNHSAEIGDIEMRLTGVLRKRF